MTTSRRYNLFSLFCILTCCLKLTFSANNNFVDNIDELENDIDIDLDSNTVDSLPDFQLIKTSYPLDDEPLQQLESFSLNDNFDDFRLNFDLILKVMEFLFSSEQLNGSFSDLAQITSFMKVSKTFYSAGQYFMKDSLRNFKFNEKFDKNLVSSLFVLLSNRKFQEIFAVLKGRTVILHDLIEIAMAAYYKSEDETFHRALRHVFNLSHHPESLAFNELEHYETRFSDPWIWIRRSYDRVFRFNQLPYSAEMYLESGVLAPMEFFNGVSSEIKVDGPLLQMFMNRILKTFPPALFGLMISKAIENNNIPVLEHLLPVAPVSLFQEDNNFLETLIIKNLFSPSLLNLSKDNPISLDKALKAALSRKNLAVFMDILNVYDFDRFKNLKWEGCKYLLSRSEKHHLYYNHRFFVDNYIRDNSDIDLFPLLMPIFDLSSVLFKEIFKRLVDLNDYDFEEPKHFDSSLIFHSIKSSENYLELIPRDATHLFIGNNGRLSHVRESINLQPNQVRFLLEHSKNPLEMLYFSYTSSDLNIVREMMHLFDINRHFVISLGQIALNPIVPNNLSFLRQTINANLLQLAVIYQRTSLVELIVRHPKFNPTEIKFRLSGRLNVIELTEALIYYESESPYLFPCAHELERVAEMLVQLI